MQYRQPFTGMTFFVKKDFFIFAENDFKGAWGFPQQAKYFKNSRSADF